jgi:hypothetical protein
MIPGDRHWRLEVEWVDSTVMHDGWQPIEAILDHRRRKDAPRCLSVGFVLADDDDGVVLAASIHGNEAVGVTVIPAQAVVRRRRLAAKGDRG